MDLIYQCAQLFLGQVEVASVVIHVLVGGLGEGCRARKTAVGENLYGAER